MLDAIDETLTIAPLPRSIIRGSTERIVRYIESTLRSNERVHSSGGQSRMVP